MQEMDLCMEADSPFSSIDLVRLADRHPHMTRTNRAFLSTQLRLDDQGAGFGAATAHRGTPVAGQVPGGPPGGILGPMTQPRSDSSADLSALFDAVGITVTDQGRARARKRLAEASARWTPERWAELRQQLGLPERAT